MSEKPPSLHEYLAVQDSIPGWLYPEDILIFQEINDVQGQDDVRGDLLEIGVYQGKSAILMGYFTRFDERLVVCDLFESPAKTSENRSENQLWYANLTRGLFEANYLRFHPELPSLVACPSTHLIRKARLKRNFRLVHIDGSHLYSIVQKDLHIARRLLIRNGIVVIDDYRSVHTPGVAAAAWQEVISGDLIPFCLTPMKMYATWDQSHVRYRKHLRSWAERRRDLVLESDTVLARELLRLRMNA